MKSLKFKHEFVREMLEGRKTTTWRLFDDKDLSVGDELDLVDRDSNESFGKAVITDVVEKKVGELTNEELVNHGYNNLDEMLNSHRGYYGDKVSLESIVKIITFKLV